MTAQQPLPYGTPDAPRVAVRGAARLEVEPETARLGITTAARGSGRRSALTDLTRRNAEVLELIKGYGEAVEKLETGSFTLSPELTGRRERVRTYHGRVRVSATIADFEVLGELTTRLADLELTQVDGPWWGLRPDSPVYRQARQQAVREAVTRAREYAGALGAELVALVELADPGSEQEAAPMAPVAPGAGRAAAYGGAPAPGSAPELDLEPASQRVYAQVSARFTISPPAL